MRYLRKGDNDTAPRREGLVHGPYLQSHSTRISALSVMHRGVAKSRRFVILCSVIALAFLIDVSRAQGQTVQGSLGGFMQLSNIADGTGSYVFGPGQTVAIDGAIPFVIACYSMLTTGKNVKPLIQVYPAADFYVIPDDGTPLIPYATKLNDISGTPNTVIGLSDGSFVDEVVAITRPAGNTGAGKYRIVMDACQTGVWDPYGGDMVLGDSYEIGFIVQEPATLPPIDLSPTKTSASEYASALSDISIGPVVVSKGACSQFKDMGEDAELEGALSSWFETALAYCADLVGEYEGLAADPPDPNYKVFAELGNIHYASYSASTPLERALRTLANAMADQDAASNAFLNSLQKFEGADQANDDEWRMLQLMQMNKFINLLIGPGGSMLRTYAALEATNIALQHDPLGGTQGAQNFEALLPTLRQTLGSMLTPLGGFFQPYNDNDGERQLRPIGLEAFIQVYLGESGDPINLPGIPQERALAGLPPIVLTYPTASTGGNYNAAPGATITLNASKSTDPGGGSLTYAWDLNGNGTFTDATGAQPQYTYSTPGTRTIGVKVTDSSGFTNVAYGLADIGDVSSQDIIAMPLSRDIYDIHPDGTYSTIRPGLGYNLGGLQTMHVDVNGDIGVLDTNIGLQHYDAQGNLIATITPAQIGALTGLSLQYFNDFAIDGSGNLDLLAVEDLGPGNQNFYGGLIVIPTAHLPGRIKLIQAALDASSAKFLSDVDQGYDSVQEVGGVLTEFIGSRDSGCSVPTGFVRVDPNSGQIVVSNVNGAQAGRCQDGVWNVDPKSGAMSEVIPAGCAYYGSSGCGFVTEDPYGSFYYSDLTFGGNTLHQGLYGFAAPSGPGEFVLDAQGNYIIGPGHEVNNFTIDRIDVPPQITNVNGILDVETFPVLAQSLGTPYLIFNSMTLDSGGNYVGVGYDYAGILSGGVFRVTPDGIITVANSTLTPPFGQLWVVDVVPQRRAVTPSDMPTPPAITLSNFNIGQNSCPSSAQLTVTVKNTGSTPTPLPVEVLFFDGDPSLGVAVGAATSGAPIPAGGSVTLSTPWTSPSPGTHQVFAMALGANIVSTTYLVCVSSQYSANPLMLSPPTGTSTTGGTYTVTAQLFDIFAGGISGAPVMFTVSGVNSANGTVTTDANGYAQFSYNGTNPGLDHIVATALSATSNTITDTWQGGLAAQTISFGPLPNVTYGVGPVTLTATASSGLPVSYSVTGPGSVTGSTLTITGVGTVTVTASQAGNASYAPATPVSQAFTVSAPALTVTPPASISVPATQANGTTGSAWPALAAFLAGATATGGSGVPLVQLPPQVNGVSANNATIFPFGTTTVTFRFQDPIGDIGTATSTVTVAIGVPRITGSIAGVGSDPSGTVYVNVVLTNTGTGNAENLRISSLTFRTLTGAGIVTCDAALSPSLPIAIGTLNVGAGVTTKLYLNVPATATRISVTESGPVQDVNGTNYNYSTAESLIP